MIFSFASNVDVNVLFTRSLSLSISIMMICKKKKIIATEIVHVAICMRCNPESPTIDELDPGDYFVKMNTICDSIQSFSKSRVVNTAIMGSMGRGKKFDVSTFANKVAK